MLHKGDAHGKALSGYVTARDSLLFPPATGHRREAIILARGLAARTDLIYKQLRDMKNSTIDSLDFDYSLKIDLDGFGKPSAITVVDAQPHEQESVNSAIRTAIQEARGQTSNVPLNSPATKSFSQAVADYMSTAGIGWHATSMTCERWSRTSPDAV